MTRRLLEYGNRAVLLECADLAEALSVQPLIKAQIEQVTEIVPGARTLLLRLSEPLTPADHKTLLSLPGQPRSAHDQESLVIEVDYSGPDLEEVCRHRLDRRGGRRRPHRSAVDGRLLRLRARIRIPAR